MATNVPAPAFTPAGLVIPAESAVLAGVQADYNAAFGGNLNPALNTPQGQLASSTAAIVADANDTFALFVNQVDPANAAGFMQDAVGYLYFMTRNPGLPTVVQATCSGGTGTVIPLGALAQDTGGNLYSCTQSGTIPAGGSIVLPFAALVDGPTACAPGALSTIYQSVPGWDGITNAAAGVVGANVETQQAFEYRRQQSVAVNAHGTTAAIEGAVFALPGVVDVLCIDNPTGSAVPTGSTNYVLAPHSIYVGVTGGVASAVAQAIWSKKDAGCAYNGSTTVSVTDAANPTAPPYQVTFNVPTPTPILFAVQIKNSSAMPSNIVALVQAAVIAQFTGANGQPRARIGGLIAAAAYYSPIIAINPAVVVPLSILLGPIAASLTNYTMGVDQAPVITPANITVTLV